MPLKKTCPPQDICRLHKLHWHILCTGGIAVIPNLLNEARLLQNLETLNHTLQEEDMTLLKDLDKGHRFIDGKFWELKTDHTLQIVSGMLNHIIHQVS